MRIALIGATGRVGSRIAAEAIRRGHRVTGVGRTAGQNEDSAGLALRQGDANRPKEVADILRGHDAVISAANFRGLKAAPLLEAVKAAGVKRLLVVGGAGSLEIAPGVALVDSPGFPEAYKVEAVPGKVFLDELRAEKDLDWTFLSPAAEFAPGERTGRYRVGGDQLLKDEDGKSRISMEDYAIAMIDELENPRHTRRRFTVAY